MFSGERPVLRLRRWGGASLSGAKGPCKRLASWPSASLLSLSVWLSLRTPSCLSRHNPGIRNSLARQTLNLSGWCLLPLPSSLEPTSLQLSPARVLPPLCPAMPLLHSPSFPARPHPMPLQPQFSQSIPSPIISALFTLPCSPEILLYPASVLVVNWNANRST